MDQALRQAMMDRLQDGCLPCTHAFSIVRALNVQAAAIGAAANKAGIHISHCQLGLFGYGSKAEGKHKIVHPMDNVPEHLAHQLRLQVQLGGITCLAVWRVADALGISRIEAASAAEAMRIRVSHCQLGCFPRPHPE